MKYCCDPPIPIKWHTDLLVYQSMYLSMHMQIQGLKKQIILLSRTSKNYGGQIILPATCPKEKCHKVTSIDSMSCHYQILHWQTLWTSMNMFGQVDLYTTCPLDKWIFFCYFEPCKSVDALTKTHYPLLLQPDLVARA